MQTPNGFLAVVATLLFPVTIGAGCASADPPAGPAISAPTIRSIPARGGVAYEATVPLDTKITPTFDEKNPPPQALIYKVAYTGGDRATVPGLFVVPTAQAKVKTRVPCALLLHGLGGSKTDVALIALGLAKQGIASLAIDIPGHGERPKINGKKTTGELTLEETRRLAGQTVVDLHKAVDLLQSRPEVDGSRIGFVGISLGGIIGGVFTADEPRIKTTCLWAAGGDWGKLLTTSAHPSAQQFRTKNALTEEAINKIMGDVDPLPLIGNLAPRPFFLINGDKDTIVPNSCIDALYSAAKEPKQRKVFPGGHIPDGLAMLTETVRFLSSTL